jgi:hypothetical protein
MKGHAIPAVIRMTTKRQSPKRNPGWRVIDLRGLTASERQLGAVVKLGWGRRYTVTAMDQKTATLEPV